MKQTARLSFGSNFNLNGVVNETARLERAAGYHFGAERLYPNYLCFLTYSAYQENVKIYALLHKLNGARGGPVG